MTSPFAAATLTYASGRVAFQNAAGLKMPFSGAVIVPRPAGETSDFGQLPAQHSLFTPLRFPKSGAGGARRFPSLRAMDGSQLSLTGNLLIFVAEDPGVFAEFDLGNIFSQHSVLTPQFPETGTLSSCRPKYMVLRLSGGAQPTEAVPKTVKAGQSLSTIVAGLPASLSGTLMTFDFAGLEIEADAALIALGETGTTGAPGGNDVRVQFVDILGKPLARNAIFGLNLDPAPTDHDLPRQVYKLAFSGSGRSLQIRQTDPFPANTNDDDKYLLRNLKVAVWPGRGAGLTKVTSTEPDFDIADGANGATPPFLRFCVFHPSQTMQTEFGGLLDADARFTRDKGATPANGFALSCETGNVEMFNDGESYLRDVYGAIEAAEPSDKIYVNNWKTHAHLHMRGTLSRLGLSPADVDKATVTAILQTIDQNRLVLNTTPTDPAKKLFLSLPDRLGRSDTLQAGLQFETRPVPSAGVADEAQSKGFFRPGGTFAFAIKDENNSPAPSRLIARWKGPDGKVSSTEVTLSTVPPQAEPALPATAFELGITPDDPPSGTIIRRQSLGDLRNDLGNVAGPLHLLVVNTSTGRFVVHDLTTADSATNHVLGELPEDSSGADQFFSVVLNANPTPSDDMASLLVSGAAELAYTPAQHGLGDIPLATEELGGLLRRAIAKGVEVRAIYWDQFLANLNQDDEFLSGHTNNEELTAILNAERNGRRGLAVRDRATRAFGSFHQKGVVLIGGSPAAVEATAWLGGIDLALGRWDSELHHEKDPDRQEGKWWDAQVRLGGPAAADILRNFSQRWRAIGEFIDDPGNFADCIPVNPDTEITQDTQTNIIRPPDVTLASLPKPKANVQITRTCPPRNCHGQIPRDTTSLAGSGPLGEIAREGELGSLAAYLKAIAMARRYILINDQYFFSPEIALALHEAISADGGPNLILMLPQDLGEDPRIDPMLFKVREKSLHILFHGGSYTPPPLPAGVQLPNIRRPHCGHVTANPVGTSTVVADRTAILFARNLSAKNVYVHSKVMMVDDVWMSVGSANLNYRSSTYDFEINASIVGNTLYFGGTDVVRRERIELTRRMLGLPSAYAPLIADAEAMFAQFKSLESKGSSPSHNLHPLGPMSEKLPPDYVKKVREAAFDGNVDVVSALGMNEPVIDGLACTIIDPDGRAEQEALAPFVALVGNATRAYAEITLTIGCEGLVSGLINGGTDSFAEILVTEAPAPTRQVHLVPLVMSGSNVVPSPSVGQILVPISTENAVVIEARVVDDTGATQGCSASHTIDPNQNPVLTGSIHDVTLNTT